MGQRPEVVDKIDLQNDLQLASFPRANNPNNKNLLIEMLKQWHS